MYSLLKIGIFQPAMLVYQSVSVSTFKHCNTNILPPKNTHTHTSRNNRQTSQTSRQMVFRMCIFRVLHGSIVNGFLLYVVFPRHPCSILMILCLKSCKFQWGENLCHIFHGKFFPRNLLEVKSFESVREALSGMKFFRSFWVCFKKHVIGGYRKIIIYFVVEFHPI